MINIKELRRLAQAATPGPWENHVGHLVLAPFEGGAASIAEMMLPYRIGYNDGEIVSDRKSNAAFISAANPAAITEILDRLEAAEKERDALRAKIERMERQEPVAWLHETRRDSDVVTDAVKHVWGKAAVGSMAAYSIPLYALPGAQTQGEEK